MSRFCEGDGENPIQYAWTGNVERICRGKRGQKILRELVGALLALPERRLIHGYLQKDGEVCAIGALAKYRGMDLSQYDSGEEGTHEVGNDLGLGYMLKWQIGAENDLYCSPLHQWTRRITLDVPITDDKAWRWGGLLRAPLTIHAEIPSGVLRGYSPEERWEHLYRWASSRIKWNLPVAAHV